VKRRALAGNLLLASGSIVLSLGAGEILLRLVPPPTLASGQRLRQIGNVNPPFLMIPDPEIGWAMAPNFEGVSRDDRWSVSIKTNSLGLRDREYGPPGPGPRILAIGDSFTFGYGVELEETFPKVAEKILRGGAFPEVEVVNAGVNGYGPLEELALMKRIVARLHANLVLMAFFEGNDVRNALAYPVQFRLGPDGFLYSRGRNPFVEPRSYLAAYAEKKWANVAEKLETRKGLELSKGAIREARRVAEEQGAGFLLVLLPTDQSGRARRSAILKAYDRLMGVPPDLNAVMEAFARSEGIEVLSLSPLFDEAADERALRYDFDGHFKASGHRVAGETVAQTLARLLGPPPGGGSGS